jgi:hypothetical protein
MKMAVRRLVSHRPGSRILREHTICDKDNFGFVAARTGAVYSEALGEKRDSCGQA